MKLYDVPFIESIQQMLIRSANIFNNKLALEDLSDTPVPRVTYYQLLDNVIKLGTALQDSGIKERTHIAVISENRVQWGIAYLTAMAFNYVAVPIDKNLNMNEILNIIHESDAEVIIFSNSYEQMMIEKRHAFRKLKHFINMDSPSPDSKFLSMVDLINKGRLISAKDLPKINPDEMAEIIFTSGSIGRAKGVMLTQKNLASNLMSMTQMVRITDEDRFLSVLPIHHTYECTCGFLCPLYTGASVHYARSLKTVAEDLQKVKATILLGVPLLYEKMFKKVSKTIREDKVKSVVVPPLVMITNFFEKAGLKEIKRKVFKELHERFGGHVRIFIAGGAAPDPEIARGLREFGFMFIQGYGLTETGPILALNRLDMFKDNAAGLPLPGVEFHINNPDSDKIGEIFAKGPNVMPGYYKNEKLTADSFYNGWFKTGDLGYIDSDGFLHISGRKKNVIIANNGKNVFPEEIEDILNRSPYILESLVYGEKDEKHDELIAVKIVIDAEAFIELSERKNEPITPAFVNSIIKKVVDDINKELTGYKQIKKFYIRDSEFEKTTTQKIKRYLVKNEDQMEETAALES